MEGIEKQVNCVVCKAKVIDYMCLWKKTGGSFTAGGRLLFEELVSTLV